MNLQNSRGLWLHGFLGNGDDGKDLFAPWTRDSDCEILCPTLPGHGLPPKPAASLTATLEHIATLAQNSDWAAGYSMGARLLMMAAARHPEAFSTLILESASLGYSDPAVREARRTLDQERAERLLREGLPAFTSWWYSIPLWKGSSPPPARQGDPAALANALTSFSSGRQPDMRMWLRTTSCRILWLAGEHDSAYVEQADEVKRLAQNVLVNIIPGAGHNIHHDQPEPWRNAVHTFLNTSISNPISQEQ